LLAGLAAGAALAAAGCGFRPLYGTGADGPVAEQFAEIRVGVIGDRSGQILRNFLIQRLNPGGRPADPAYELSVELVERQQELAITQDDVAERTNLFVTAAYALRDLSAGEPLLRETSTTITSFAILRDEVATLSAEQDARVRALRRLSDQIRLRLALYFQNPEGYRRGRLGPAADEETPADPPAAPTDPAAAPSGDPAPTAAE
jgi:LPS-assembly lipoprotein